MPAAQRAFPAASESVGDARRHVRSTLTGWDAVEFEWAAMALVSELATNAVLHARTPFTVRLDLAADVLRVEVSDDSVRRPTLRRFADDATTGRGLAMLASVANATGVDMRPGGKTVWCELTLADVNRSWDYDEVYSQVAHDLDDVGAPHGPTPSDGLRPEMPGVSPRE